MFTYSLLLFSHSVVNNSLWSHGLQHTRLPCPSPSPGACSKSCPLSQWCHPTISSSVVASPPAFNLSQPQGLFQWVGRFTSCLQSFPASGSFPMSWLFASDGQSIGASASALVLLMNIQGFSFRIGQLVLLANQGTLKSLLQNHSSKASILWCSVFIMSNSHTCTFPVGKNYKL